MQSVLTSLSCCNIISMKFQTNKWFKCQKMRKFIKKMETDFLFCPSSMEVLVICLALSFSFFLLIPTFCPPTIPLPCFSSLSMLSSSGFIKELTSLGVTADQPRINVRTHVHAFTTWLTCCRQRALCYRPAFLINLWSVCASASEWPLKIMQVTKRMKLFVTRMTWHGQMPHLCASFDNYYGWHD